jgi:hypothetical protein
MIKGDKANDIPAQFFQLHEQE